MSELGPEDRSWIEVVERELRPAPLDARRALAFRRALEQRLARRDARRALAWPSLAGAAAAAALALWWALPLAPTPSGVEPVARYATVGSFVDPDGGEDELGAAPDYLPDDYQVLAALLDDSAP